MTLSASFPFDWILPGEFRYCGCGRILLPEGQNVCAYCKYLPKLSDYKCGVCGEEAHFMDVNGFRCTEHIGETAESGKIEGSLIVGTAGVRKVTPPAEQDKRTAELDECERTHKELLAKRESVARNRQLEGLPPLFWLNPGDKKKT